MRSLRATLVVGTTVGMAAVLLVAGTVVYALVRARLLEQLDSSLLDKAGLLASAVEREGAEIDLGFDELDLSAYRSPDGPGYLQLRRGDGSVLYRSASLGGRDLHAAPLAAATPAHRWLDLGGGRTGRAVTIAFQPRRDEDGTDDPAEGGGAPTTGEGAPAGRVTLVLAWDASPTMSALASLRTVLLVVGLVAMGASSALLWLVIRRSLAPLQQLAERIGTLDEHRLTDRVAIGAGPSELRPVVSRLNGLLERLDAAFQRERGFSAEVAHELRTPLAALRATLEVARSRPREPADYGEMIGDCQGVVARMGGMVEKLLAMARLESGQIETDPEPVVLEEVARAQWRSLEGRAGERKLQVQWRSGTGRAVRTDRKLLSLIVGIVLDNAVTHAEQAGRVEVDVRDDDEPVRLRVANTGCAVPPGQADMVFERFWRADAARSGENHCGLGLSLAKRAVQALGGSIAASAAREGWFEVTLGIPPLPGPDAT